MDGSMRHSPYEFFLAFEGRLFVMNLQTMTNDPQRSLVGMIAPKYEARREVMGYLTWRKRN